MSFVDKVRVLAERAPTIVEHLSTEEASKTSLVLPFIAALGYDIFDPTEVVPEFTADVGVKKGEKVDYAIKHDGAEMMLFECKSHHTKLDNRHASQLYRYFSVTKARIAVLTNGTEYRFFSDLEDANKMDERPFLVLDLLNLREDSLTAAQRLTKEGFAMEEVLTAAGELKYLREIRLLLDTQFSDPEEDFVRFFHSRVSSGRFTANARDAFSQYVKQALALAVKDRVSGRLRSALQAEVVEVGESVAPPALPADVTSEAIEVGKPGIETTDDELAGFRVVQAIACEVLPVSRITHRDGKSYFAVLVDNNNRKPLCRLWFNQKQWYLGLLDEQKSETRHPIDGVDAIYQHAAELKACARRYAES